MDHDLLSKISGDILSAALRLLPDATLSEEDTRRVVVDLDGLHAEVTFARLKRPSRKKKQPADERWYWTPAIAVLVEGAMTHYKE